MEITQFTDQAPTGCSEGQVVVVEVLVRRTQAKQVSV